MILLCDLQEKVSRIIFFVETSHRAFMFFIVSILLFVANEEVLARSMTTKYQDDITLNIHNRSVEAPLFFSNTFTEDVSVENHALNCQISSPFEITPEFITSKIVFSNEVSHFEEQEKQQLSKIAVDAIINAAENSPFSRKYFWMVLNSPQFKIEFEILNGPNRDATYQPIENAIRLKISQNVTNKIPSFFINNMIHEFWHASIAISNAKGIFHSEISTTKQLTLSCPAQPFNKNQKKSLDNLLNRGIHRIIVEIPSMLQLEKEGRLKQKNRTLLNSYRKAVKDYNPMLFRFNITETQYDNYLKGIKTATFPSPYSLDNSNILYYMYLEHAGLERGRRLGYAHLTEPHEIDFKLISLMRDTQHKITNQPWKDVDYLQYVQYHIQKEKEAHLAGELPYTVLKKFFIEISNFHHKQFKETIDIMKNLQLENCKEPHPTVSS